MKIIAVIIYNCDDKDYNTQEIAYNSDDKAFSIEVIAYNFDGKSFSAREIAYNSDAQGFNLSEIAYNFDDKAFFSSVKGFVVKEKLNNAPIFALLRQLLKYTARTINYFNL